MEILLEFLLEVIIGGAFDVADDEEVPKRFRIGCLSFVTLIYLVFVGLFVYLLVGTAEVVVKVISAGVLLLFAVAFIKVWRNVIKSKNDKKIMTKIIMTKIRTIKMRMTKEAKKQKKQYKQ